MQSVLSLAVSGVQCQMSCIYRTLSTTRPTDPVRFKHLSPPPDIRPAYNGLLLRALVRANLCIAPQVPLTSFRPSQQNTPFSLGVAASPRALLADVPDDTCSNKPLYDGIHNIASTLPRLLPCQRSLSLVRCERSPSRLWSTRGHLCTSFPPLPRLRLALSSLVSASGSFASSMAALKMTVVLTGRSPEIAHVQATVLYRVTHEGSSI